MITVSLTQNTITPELQRLMREFARPRALLGAGAKAVQRGILEHLAKLQARGNERGWPSQKFFVGKPTSVAKNVGISELTDHAATITIADPRFVHRIEGGTITPKRAKYLAIPLTAAAYAKSGHGSLRESWPGLEFQPGKGGKAYLKSGDTLQFALLKSVSHKARPEEMPDAARLGDLAREAMLRAARILMKA